MGETLQVVYFISNKMTYYEKNKEKRAAYLKANKEKIASKKREYEAANKERIDAYQADYRKKNSKKRSEWSRSYRKANPEVAAAQCKKYRDNNKGKRAALAVKYYATKRDQTQELVSIDRKTIDYFYDQMKRLNSIFGAKTFHVDHTTPLSLGGAHHPNNLQVVPAKWNLKKNNTNSNRWEAPFGA